jgi:hypothetical protein
MVTPEVTVSDIENEWRPLSDAEKAVIPGKSANAWTRIKADTRDIEEKMSASPEIVSLDVVHSVMVSMIIRVLKNQQSARQISKSMEDWSKSVTLDSSVSSGEMYVSDYEHGLLNPSSGIPEYSMYVVELGG